jgi:hypothetical protein
MVRRVVAGLVLGLIVFGAASIVSRGIKNPDFIRPPGNRVDNQPPPAVTVSLTQ